MRFTFQNELIKIILQKALFVKSGASNIWLKFGMKSKKKLKDNFLNGVYGLFPDFNKSDHPLRFDTLLGATFRL
jgi:hypothetical protein